LNKKLSAKPGAVQSEYLPTRQVQHVRRIVDAQPTIIDLRQNLNPVQLALAHQYPSHVRSSSHQFARRVTFLNCSWVTLSLCAYISRTHNAFYV
jgi:hypothetical protein